jgi:hypothetical protein
MTRKTIKTKTNLIKENYIPLGSTESLDNGLDIVTYFANAKKNSCIAANRILMPLIGQKINATGSSFGFEDVILKEVFFDDYDNELYITVLNKNGKKETGPFHDMMDCTDY